jgi:hypothetical protein
MPPVRPSLRKVLAESYVAAVAIAVLLLWTIVSVVRALGPLVLSGVSFFVRALAIRGIPTYSEGYWLGLALKSGNLLDAVFFLIPAWLLSRWVYETSPFKGLSQCRNRLERRYHV